MVKARVLIADDHALVVEAFKKLLEPEFKVVGVASDGRELLELAREVRPDVVLLDLGMPILNGFDAGQRLKKLLPAAKMLVVTMNEDADTAAAALREWASGYVLKSSDATELRKAIIAVMNGKKYVSQRIADRQSQQFIWDPRRTQTRHLTNRQREVLQLLAEGHSMKQAAAELHITPRTIAFHKYQIMQEYGLRNNSELLRFAIKQQVVARPEIEQTTSSGPETPHMDFSEAGTPKIHNSDFAAGRSVEGCPNGCTNSE
jgi:DNA-binding NarL/FixJ family response regulator